MQQIFLMAVSVGLQLIAALLAIRLIRVTGRRTAWGLVALAILLMAARRAITLARLLAGDASYPLDPEAELVATAISLLMVAGLAMIVPYFKAMQRSREMMQEREAHFRHLFRQMPMPYQSLDHKGRLVEVNPAWLGALGYQRHEAMGRPLSDLVDPEHRQLFKDSYGRLRQEGQISGVRLNLVCKDGALLPVEFAGRLDSGQPGRPRQCHCVFQDITERQRYEQALRENEARYRRIIETAQEGVWLIDDQAQTTFVNQSMADMLGYTPPEMLGFAMYQFMDPTLVDQAQRKMERRRQGIRERYDFRLRRKDGSDIWAFLSASPIFSDQGHFLGVLNMVTDVTGRRQAEMERDLLYDLSPDMLCISGFDGSLKQINPAWSRILGWSQQDLCGKPWMDLVHPQDRQVTLEAGEQLVAGRPLQHFENRYRCKDGTYRWLSWNTHPLPGEQLIFAVVRDISEQKQAEEASRLNEARLEALFRLNQMGDASLEQVTQFALQEGVRLTGSRTGFLGLVDHRGKLMRVHSHPLPAGEPGAAPAEPQEIPLEEAGLLAQPLLNPKPLLLNELSAHPASQRGRPLDQVELDRLLVVPIMEGEQVAAVVAVGDKDEPYDETDLRQLALLVDGMWGFMQRKLAQEALKASEERFRQLAENISEVFFLRDLASGRMLYVSPAYELIWGRSAQELFNDPTGFLEAVHPADRDRVEGAYRNLETGELFRKEYRIVRPDGELRWISSRNFPIRDADGQVYRVAGVAEDITARKRDEADRLEMEDRLRQKQKLESLGVVAGGVAHDFNNLLQGIMGYAELGQSEDDQDEASRSRYQKILELGQRAAEIIHQMLAYSGQGRLRNEPVDISERVQELAPLLESAAHRQTRLNFKLAEDLPLIEADPGQVTQVIMNLVINASEALADHPGQITIATSQTYCSRRFLQSTYHYENQPAGDYVMLEVADNGSGMDQETQRNIFDPFFSTKFTGRGLGLASVFGIVRGHHGALMLESKPGRGSTFRVLFQASQLKAREIPPPPQVTGRLQGTVLVVDDEYELRASLRIILRQMGLKTITAGDGLEGLQIFREQAATIDVVLLDLTMPGLGGEEVLAQMKLIRPQVPVVLISGYSHDDVIERIPADSLAGFLQKPFSSDDLQEVLRLALLEDQASCGQASVC